VKIISTHALGTETLPSISPDSLPNLQLLSPATKFRKRRVPYHLRIRTGGVEKLIRIQQPTGVKKGRADAYYGNAIIEFENSLDATLSEAEGQLREYVAGTWQKQNDEVPRSILAIASDGIEWRLYFCHVSNASMDSGSPLTLAHAFLSAAMLSP
jgi:hypothetical protein